MKIAREENKKAHIFKNKLFIEGKPYTYEALKNIQINKEKILEKQHEEHKFNSTTVEENKLAQKRKATGGSPTQNQTKKSTVDYCLRNRNPSASTSPSVINNL